MKWPYRYDVAISVAEEDRHVADALVPELKKKRICYYYYGENSPNTWGEDIIKLTIRYYGKRSRFVLLLTSETSVKKYWADVELKVALSENGNVLQLRLDDTPVDGISIHTIYRNWKEDPAEIAAALKEKIRKHKRRELMTMARFLLMTVFVLFPFIYFPLRPQPRGELPVFDRVIVTGAQSASGKGKEHPDIGQDSFYMSSTEVTIADFRKYCKSEHKSLPPQPPHTGDDSPIRNITWHEAQAFCKWVNGRLPTVTEWVYAAGNGVTKYSGGGTASLVAVYNKAKPLGIRSRKPNDLGIYDMSGNVAEWCEDWSDDRKEWKVVKGGAYNSSLDGLAVESVGFEHPYERRPEIGFRVVWDK